MVGEWREVKLGEVVRLNPDTIGGDWPYSYIKYIDISSVGEGLILEPPQVLRLDEAPSRAKRLVQEGDTVLSTVRPGRRSMFFVKQADPEWVVSTGFAVLRPRKECIEPRYLYACVYDRAFTQFLVRREKGAAYPAVLPEDIADAVIKLPPLPEQRAIAHILGTLDDKIELNRRMSETLEAMARALFKAWFVDFEPVRAKMEGRWQRGQSLPGLPAHLYDLFPDRLVDSELGPIPEGWKVGTLADLAVLNPEVWKTETRPAKIIYVDLSNTKWGRIDSLTTYDSADAPSRAQRVLRPGDTIVGTVRPGNGSYAFIAEGGLTGSTGFAVLRPRAAHYAEIVYLAATAPDNIDRLAHLADGAAYPAVRPEVVAATPVVCPGDEVLARFSQAVGPALAKIAQNERASRTLAALRDALLPKLIRGEIRVKDAERFLKEREL
jgi:type I restriction enzyme S subunit